MKVEQTYIFRNGEPAFFISTINRISSTTPPMEYAETLAWEIGKDYKRGDIVEQSESNTYSTAGHDRIVEKLRSKTNKGNK